jgi:hypothetical protein
MRKSSIKRKMAMVRSFRKSINSKRAKRKTMAKRRTTRRIKSGISRIGKARGKFGSFLKKGTIGETTQALGAGLVVSAVTDRLAPQFTPFAAAGAEYAAGGVKGMIIAELIKPIIGLPSILPSITGGFGSLFGGPTAGAPTETI